MSAAGDYNDNANPDDIIVTIIDTKLYVPVVTLSAKYNQKLPKLPSTGFERSVYWNEYIYIYIYIHIYIYTYIYI